MSELIRKQLQALSAAHTTEEIDLVVDQISNIGEAAIPELLQYAMTLYPWHRKLTVLMRIFQKMGYPANRSAIRVMVGETSNINSSGWEIALNTIKEIGGPAIPEVQAALRFYAQDLDTYNLEIQGLATLLELMDSPTIDSLLPDLLTLLEAGTDENHVDEYALWPLRKIGSPKADVALTHIGKIIASRRNTAIREAAIDALHDFNYSAIRSLVPILKRCTFDDEEAIRQSAEKVLTALGKG